MTVEPDHCGYRIEVNAQYVDGAWDAEVRIRRTLSEAKPHFERVTCYARRWVDRRPTG